MGRKSTCGARHCCDPSEEPTAAPGPAADHLGGAQGACKVSDRQRNASLSGIASKLEGGALDEITRKECARGRTSAASQLLGTQNSHRGGEIRGRPSERPALRRGSCSEREAVSADARETRNGRTANICQVARLTAGSVETESVTAQELKRAACQESQRESPSSARYRTSRLFKGANSSSQARVPTF